MTDETIEKPGQRSGLNLGVTIAAYLMLAAGLLMGIMALLGPLAVWLGMADFRFGFGLLQTVNSWAGWIAIAALLVAVAIFALARLQNLPRGNQYAGIALVGMISAGLAWYIPLNYAPAEGTPPIHDIATDPDDPLEYIAIAPLRADAPNNMEYGVMPGMTPEEHRQAQREFYPDITPQRFDASADEVYQRALAAAEQMGWEIIDTDPAARRIEATDTTFWFRFKDDVVIEVAETADGAVLNARSLSRVGRSDVGKNAARLREFFALL